MGGSDLITGTLDILILKAVATGPLHGYAIGRWLRSQSDDILQIDEGVLYPALHRLGRRGLLSAKWGHTDTGRRARFYALTPAGRERLQSEKTRWIEYSQAVRSILLRPEG